MRRPGFVLLALALSIAAPAAHAQQVTDEERAAARNLYYEGVKLQEAGNYPDALDRFTRAQRIFSAPTHVLRIAECQAAMFKLVEAAESYRALVKADLGKNPPAAFVQAQQQAAAELPAVEARIPSLKVDIQPPNVQNPVFTVNNQPVNSALIGVARPVNPGTHTIAVTAPGYGKAEQTITLKEKEQRAITLTLQPGGVVYGPTPVVPVYTVPVQGQPQPMQPQPQPDKPPEYKPDERPKPSSAGFLAGVRLGAGIPAGDLQKTSTTSALKMGDVATPGLAIGVDVGFRVATKLVIGVMYEFGTYGQADKVKQNASPTDTITTSQSSSLVNGYLGFTSNPEGTGFYGEVGFGYRWFSQSQKIVSGAGVTTVDGTTVARGTEFDFGLGVWVAAAPWLRIIPKVSVGIGSFSDIDNGATSTSLTSDARATHTFVFLGVNGFYNLDFGKSDQAKK